MKLKDLALYSPIIGAFLAFIGVFKLEVFYSHFGISIIDYLDFSEIITSFLDDITLILAFLCVMLFHIIIGSGILKVLMNAGRKRKASFDSIARLALYNYSKSYAALIVPIIISITSFWFFYQYSQKWLIYFVAFFFYQALVVSFDILQKKNKDISEAKLFSFSFVLLVFFMSWAIALFEIRMAEKGLTDRTTVITEDLTITSSQNRVYLGKTEKYLFFYEKPTGKVEVFTTDKLKVIVKEKTNNAFHK